MSNKHIIETVLILSLATSCQVMTPHEVLFEQNRQVTTKDGLTVQLKEGMPSDVLELSLNNYKNRVSFTAQKTMETGVPVSLGQLADLSQEINRKKNFPDLNRLNNEDRTIILEDFPDLTAADIPEYMETIREVYSRQGTYELFTVTQEQIALNKGYPGQPSELSNEEYWLLVWNFWKIDGTEKATNLAIDYEMKMFPIPGGGRRDKADAFRHAIWNVLMAKYTDGNKKDRENWAKAFADAHENGNPSPTDNSFDNLMDFHNNVIGRDYWNAVVTESGALWWYSISIPSDDVIKAALYPKAAQAVYCVTSATINQAHGQLVYIPYTVPYPAP